MEALAGAKMLVLLPKLPGLWRVLCGDAAGPGL
jgi:hypothetical protein